MMRPTLGDMAALLIGACGLVGVVTLLLRPPAAEGTAPNPAMIAAVEPSSEPLADWCPPDFEPIAGGGCLAASRATGAGSRLLVYLHGRYARDAPEEEIDRQRRLASLATARGFAVLSLRGRLGACAAPELANWFCWPSSEHHAADAATVVAGWARALATAQQRVGPRSPVLLGFSNGGYFAGLIALRGLLDVDAVVVAHGGLVEPARAARDGPPLLLLSADDDIAQDDMIRFDEELARVHWAHDSYARSGGHGLTNGDIDAALTFFSRASETFPLEPPLPLHRAVRHARDAGGPAQIPDEWNASAGLGDASDSEGDESTRAAADEADQTDEAGW
jgi:predicted esterase